MNLPKVPYSVRKTQSEVVSMRGINYSDMLRDGDLRESLNLSARRFPYISTRKAREKQAGENFPEAFALTEWDGKLVVVNSTTNDEGEPVANIWYGDTLLKNADGNPYELSVSGEKQFAVVGNKLVIFPDKVFFDLSADNETVQPLSEAIYFTNIRFYASHLIYGGNNSKYYFTNKGFEVGDVIYISGCSVEKNNKRVIITGIDTYSLTVKNEDGSEDVFEPVGSSDKQERIYISAAIPNLDFICESDNRLMGCSNEDGKIYVSALGEPSQFYTFEGADTDSFSAAVGTDGDFTGCCRLGSSVLFWKEDKLHKLLGSFPSEYTLYAYSIDGVQKGSHKSLQTINEVLYYMGLYGVYAYTGGAPTRLSDNFGERAFTDGVAGSDGERYYLSVKEGDKTHLIVYDTRAGLWLREDDKRVRDFARVGKDLYFLDSDGQVWLENSGADDPNIEWLAQLTPFYETIQGRKSYSKMLIRAEIPKGSYLIAEVRCDGREWKSCGKVVGRDNDVTPLRIPINRCDKFEIRLRGKGPCTILSVLREFSVGSGI